MTRGNSEETKRCKYHSEEWVTELTIQKYFNPLDPSRNYKHQKVLHFVQAKVFICARCDPYNNQASFLYATMSKQIFYNRNAVCSL